MSPVIRGIIEALKPFLAREKTLTYNNGKKFSEYGLISAALCQLGAKP
jgi:hypothetical protein